MSEITAEECKEAIKRVGIGADGEVRTADDAVCPRCGSKRVIQVQYYVAWYKLCLDCDKVGW